MSWLFGKKKHHRESPPETPEEPSLNNAQSEDYIIVEKEENPSSPTTSMASGSLYPHLGPTPYPPLVLQLQNQSSDSQSYMSGIPFKLSKALNNDFEIERLRIDEITSFVHQIINQDYDYEFSLERSVINEMEREIETIKMLEL